MALFNELIKLYELKVSACFMSTLNLSIHFTVHVFAPNFAKIYAQYRFEIKI